MQGRRRGAEAGVAAHGPMTLTRRPLTHPRLHIHLQHPQMATTDPVEAISRVWLEGERVNTP